MAWWAKLIQWRRKLVRCRSAQAQRADLRRTQLMPGPCAAVISGTMKRMSPEQRELCRLLSPLHETYCEKHNRSGCEAQDHDDATGVGFSLAEFRSALDELWSAAKALDRSLKQRSGPSIRSTTHKSGARFGGFLDETRQSEPPKQSQA
jgi:hypothetical protein